jgi:hypothetical protein
MCRNYKTHTLNKNKLFSQFHCQKKGGGRQPSAQKKKNFGATEISGRWVAGRSKKIG